MLQYTIDLIVIDVQKTLCNEWKREREGFMKKEQEQKYYFLVTFCSNLMCNKILKVINSCEGG